MQRNCDILKPLLVWDHNAYHHRVVLRHLPPRLDRVLEVGCGTGELATKLAARARQVDAVDRDPSMIAAARASVPANVICLESDLMELQPQPEVYEAVVSLSTLHHLELEPALATLAHALRPGGRLVAIAHARLDLPREIPHFVAGRFWHFGLGAFFAATRHPLRRAALDQEDDEMPVRMPTLTFREVRPLAHHALPGAEIQRIMPSRYLLTWHKP